MIITAISFRISAPSPALPVNHDSRVNYLNIVLLILCVNQTTDDIMGHTTIKIKNETRDRLAGEGLFTESYDKVINRLLDELNELRKKK